MNHVHKFCGVENLINYQKHTVGPHGPESLRWRHNGRDDVSNHQPHVCLLNSLFGRRSKKASKFRVTGLCVGNSPGTGEFPAQMASHTENVSIWWRHHDAIKKSETEVACFTHSCCSIASNPIITRLPADHSTGPRRMASPTGHFSHGAERPFFPQYVGM